MIKEGGLCVNSPWDGGSAKPLVQSGHATTTPVTKIADKLTNAKIFAIILSCSVRLTIPNGSYIRVIHSPRKLLHANTIKLYTHSSRLIFI
jgi:hypothetical protein